MRSGGSIRDPLETRPGSMNSIDQMVYDQPGIITQVTGALISRRFWEATFLCTTNTTTDRLNS